MAMSQEGNLFAPRMILFITKVEDEKRLEELGFMVEESKKHCKITYFGDHRYFTVLGSTPSDVRSGKNNAAMIVKMAY